VVLERAIREEIRETNLADEKRKVAARVRLDLPEEDAAVVTEIVQNLLVPNSFYNTERTEERRQLAREGVEPVTAAVERNETILRAGDIATSMDIEALDALGLRRRGGHFIYAPPRHVVTRPGLSLLLLATRTELVVGSLGLADRRALDDGLCDHRESRHSYSCASAPGPYAALTMLLSVTVRFRLALLLTGLFAVLVGWLSVGDVELMAYALLPGLVGAIKLRRGEHLASFAWAAVYVALTNVLVILAFRVGSGDWDVRGLAELVGVGLFNGLISMAATLLGVYLVGAAFGVTTSLQLMELRACSSVAPPPAREPPALIIAINRANMAKQPND
jgi:membrane-associated HD superfamily phosphohydrolase